MFASWKKTPNARSTTAWRSSGSAAIVSSSGSRSPLRARPARERADPLDEVEHLLPLLLDEHAPEEVAEQADVRTQAGIGSHTPSLRAREARRRAR